MAKFLILAVADTTKSLQAQKDENSNKNGNQRNISIDTDEQQSENNSNWNSNSRTNSINANQIGSLKFILKPIDIESNSEMITAFEYDGSISKNSGLDQGSMVGCILECNCDLDFARSILLLRSSSCRILKPNSTPKLTDILTEDPQIFERNASNQHININTDTQSINRNVNFAVDPIDLDPLLDDEVLDDLFNQDEDFLFV